MQGRLQWVLEVIWFGESHTCSQVLGEFERGETFASAGHSSHIPAAESVGLTCAGEAIPIEAFSAGTAVGPWCVDAVGVQVALVLFSCTLIQVWGGKSTLSIQTHIPTHTPLHPFIYTTHIDPVSPCTCVCAPYIHQHIPTHLLHPHIPAYLLHHAPTPHQPHCQFDICPNTSQYHTPTLHIPQTYALAATITRILPGRSQSLTVQHLQPPFILHLHFEKSSCRTPWAQDRCKPTQPNLHRYPQSTRTHQYALLG